MKNAKVFGDTRKLPKKLDRREEKTPVASCKSKATPKGAMSQQETSVPGPLKVKILSDGAIDQSMTVGDVVQSLALTGNGVGQRVHVKSMKTLMGTGIAFSATEVRIHEWNHRRPP